MYACVCMCVHGRLAALKIRPQIFVASNACFSTHICHHTRLIWPCFDTKRRHAANSHADNRHAANRHADNSRTVHWRRHLVQNASESPDIRLHTIGLRSTSSLSTTYECSSQPCPSMHLVRTQLGAHVVRRADDLRGHSDRDTATAHKAILSQQQTEQGAHRARIRQCRGDLRHAVHS